jgi:chromosome partitioning protein
MRSREDWRRHWYHDGLVLIGAVHLAVAAHLDRQDAAIIDLDPQASSADWSDRRGDVPFAAATPPARLDKMLEQVAQYDLVIIDTGRDSHNTGYTAACAADLVLIPFRSGGFDFAALGRSLGSIHHFCGDNW